MKNLLFNLFTSIENGIENGRININNPSRNFGNHILKIETHNWARNMMDGYSVDVYNKDTQKHVLSYEYDNKLDSVKFSDNSLFIELIENGEKDKLVSLKYDYNIKFENEKELLLSCIVNNKPEISEYFYFDSGNMTKEELKDFVNEYDCDLKRFYKILMIPLNNVFHIDIKDSGIKLTFDRDKPEMNSYNLELLKNKLQSEIRKDVIKLIPKISEEKLNLYSNAVSNHVLGNINYQLSTYNNFNINKEMNLNLFPEDFIKNNQNKEIVKSESKLIENLQEDLVAEAFKKIKLTKENEFGDIPINGDIDLIDLQLLEILTNDIEKEHLQNKLLYSQLKSIEDGILEFKNGSITLDHFKCLIDVSAENLKNFKNNFSNLKETFSYIDTQISEIFNKNFSKDFIDKNFSEIKKVEKEMKHDIKNKSMLNKDSQLDI